MKIYELNYLLPKTLKQSQRRETALKIESLIQDEGGILIQERKKEEIKLGQPIQEKEKALLFTSRFQVGAGGIKEIEKKLKADPGILRCMIEKTAPARRKVKKKRKRPSKKPRSSKNQKEEAKVELEKIEQKLDEILNESR